MKKNTGIILFILSTSIISGYLMSKASMIGKAGMSLFYREYNFLKTWWKGALLMLAALGLLYIIQEVTLRKYPPAKARVIYIITCVISVIGLYFTYNDFRHTLSHRLLGERFHLGVYLFWLGWLGISFFYLVNLKPEATANKDREKQ